MSQVIMASFNGVPCNAEYSMVLGTSSGSGTIDFPNTGVNLPFKGTLILSDGTNQVILNNMYVDKPRIEYDAIGGARLSATIYDRRYAWQWGYIVGKYNHPDITNTPTEEVPLIDLMRKCLDFMDETDYVIVGVPTAFPKVTWEPENPADALEDLCEQFGLVIGLDTSKPNCPVIICPYDYDRTIPDFVNTVIVQGVSAAIKPEEIIFFGGRKVIQEEFKDLIPVGEDTNGDIKRIEDLSYAPADWGDSLRRLFTDLATQEQRELADKCIFKWYAIDWDKYDPTLILPLLTEIVDTVVDEGTLKHDKPYIKGEKSIWDGISYKTSSDEKISEGYSIDKNLGIVKFTDLVVKPKADNYSSGGFEAGKLNLVAAYKVKENKTSDLYVDSVVVPNGTELPFIYEDKDAVVMYKKSGTTLTPQNFDEVHAHSQRVLAALLKYFVNRYPKIYTYPGIFNVGVWGSIRNVVWRADAVSGALTEVHKDMEIPKPLLPDFEDRKMRKKFKVLWRTRKDSREVRKEWPFE